MRCCFYGCGSEEGVEVVEISEEIQAPLCIGHARISLSARHSTVMLIEFLVALKGNSPAYRRYMRNFVLSEVNKSLRGT